jgi:hypothetical protein
MATEGALAPDPMARLMPTRLEREIPGRRKREPSWKDEVRQRVNRRRAERLGGEPPLVPEPEPVAEVELEMAPAPVPAPPAARVEISIP